MADGSELPYVSSQAIRRALRDKLEEMGEKISEVIKPKSEKGAFHTIGKPDEFIDDDLFGFMQADKGEPGEKGKSITRTSPIRVEALIAQSPYMDNSDFGVNYMGRKIGGDPNIFETEIHSGIYRGTILIELDRIGREEGFKKEMSLDQKKERVKKFLIAFRTLWSSGRQTRFLADTSPKFIAAAWMTSKNPIFLDAVKADKNKMVNMTWLTTVLDDYKPFIHKHVFAVQEAIFPKQEGMISLAEGFSIIESWIDDQYK